MTNLDLVIRGGTLATATRTGREDLGIKDGVIAAIGPSLEGRKVIDATGLLVLPGAVDPHVHLDMPAGATRSSDDWCSGTRAAACGGTTTVIDFVEPEPGEILLDAFRKRRQEAAGAIVDYALHMTLTNARDETLAQIPDVVAAGMTSFKTYTTYEGFRLDDAAFLRVMRAVRDASGLVMAHCENDAIVTDATARLAALGRMGPGAHPYSRPGIAEATAIRKILSFAQFIQVPVYIVHVSTALGSQAIAWAQVQEEHTSGGRRTVPVGGETCPQYLTLTASEYDQPGFAGAKYVCAPPLRTPHDQQMLWNALATGTLQTVGTDHCPFNFSGQKDLGRDDFRKIPGGLPGIEARLALLHTFGVLRQRITLKQWVALCCENPARWFGLYPRKGTLEIGSDADVVLFDPSRQVTLSTESLHESVDYTPYEGFALTGYPVMTLIRGKIVMQEGNVVSDPGLGHYLFCDTPGLI
ncbi:MAG: dihydropyrimidinase [Anaerolineae bacterium]|nr:dihydropyrimidinase [Anaerolineae bacterium]